MLNVTPGRGVCADLILAAPFPDDPHVITVTEGDRTIRLDRASAEALARLLPNLLSLARAEECAP
jgi:hypothetical protein